MSFEFLGIDHVQLAAPEGCETEARHFFGNLLGWEEIQKPESLLKRGGVWFKCGVHQVHIGVQTPFIAATKAHPAFHVKQIEALKNHFHINHLIVIDDDHRGAENIKRFFTRDPFGNRIEFIESEADCNE